MTLHSDKPELFLIHGWGMNSAVWNGIHQPLREQYSIHYFELPGHGHQSSSQPFDLQQVTALALQAAPPHAVWLGWSLGGIIALQAALLHPERITRLLLVASSPCFTSRDDWPHAVDAKILQQFHAALQQDFAATLQRFLSLQVRGSDHARETLRTLREDLLACPPAQAQALQCGLEILRTTDLRSQLHQLRLPVHFIIGNRDTLLPIEAAQASARLLANAQLHEIPGAGHAPFVSHRESFLAIVGKCLEGVTTSVRDNNPRAGQKSA